MGLLVVGLLGCGFVFPSVHGLCWFCGLWLYLHADLFY